MRKARSVNHSVVAAIVVVVVLGLWLASGLIGDDATDESADSDDGSTDEPMSVAVTRVSPSPMQREIVLHGELQAKRRLDIKAETSGTVAALAVERGQRIKRGDVLIVLDEGDRAAALAEAEAGVTLAQSEQKAAASLRRQGLQSQMQLEQSAAALESARAQLARIETDLANTKISAPFDGVVNELVPEVGQLLERGDPVAELIDDSRFDVIAEVSQQRRGELEPGQAVSIEPITGGELDGTLRWISSTADPSSRSFTIEAEVGGTGRTLPSGISATIRIPVETVDAVFVTPSALSLDSKGDLGVKVVDANDRVSFVPVTLVSTSLEGAWVEGIEPDSRLIVLGQGFVNAGERVRPQPDEDSSDDSSASGGQPNDRPMHEPGSAARDSETAQ